MAKGIPYFPLDCQLNDKVALIEAEFGLTGFAVVVKLYQRIYGQQGYYCEFTNEVALLFGRDIGLGGNAVSEIVSAAIKRGIFDKQLYEKYQILTSVGIQERYFEAVIRRKKVEVEKRYLLLKCDRLSENAYISEENVSIIEENADISKQRKEKKTKVKERKVKDIVADEPPTTSSKQQKHKHGEYSHVLITDDEYNKMLEDYGEAVTAEYIMRLDEYIENTHKHYANHNLTMRNWMLKANIKKLSEIKTFTGKDGELPY